MYDKINLVACTCCRDECKEVCSPVCKDKCVDVCHDDCRDECRDVKSHGMNKNCYQRHMTEKQCTDKIVKKDCKKVGTSHSVSGSEMILGAIG
jgi:hypothetical protein